MSRAQTPSNAPATRRVRGRFAPSPTGPLHLGSLASALASCLETRRQGGEWLVRVEDLDPPREVDGAADVQLRQLEALGFEWDGEVLYQSTRHEAYAEAIATLKSDGRAYDCSCSRRQVAEAGLVGAEGPVYPGTCRAGPTQDREQMAVRFRVDERMRGFDDRWQGRWTQDVAGEVGDFVIRRADGPYAYQLAVVVDDAFQGITEVIRGMDLIESTARQIMLQDALDLPVPAYGHHALLLDRFGTKLSKSEGAAAVETQRPDAAADSLARALTVLQHPPPAEAVSAGVEGLWDWSRRAWEPQRLCDLGHVQTA